MDFQAVPVVLEQLERVVHLDLSEFLDSEVLQVQVEWLVRQVHRVFRAIVEMPVQLVTLDALDW